MYNKSCSYASTAISPSVGHNIKNKNSYINALSHCLILYTFPPHTVHNFEFKVQSCSLRMRTNEENGVADEAIVIEWVVQAPREISKLSKSDGVMNCSV